MSFAESEIEGEFNQLEQASKKVLDLEQIYNRGAADVASDLDKKVEELKISLGLSEETLKKAKMNKATRVATLKCLEEDLEI